MPLYILAASLTMNGPQPGQITRSLIQGYRIAPSEDAARGNFIESAFSAKPNFAIDQVLCVAVPPNDLEAALAAST